MPNPPRSTVLEVRVAAKPTRGEKSLKSIGTPPLFVVKLALTPLAHATAAAFAPKARLQPWPRASMSGVMMSYRSPRFNVSLWLTRQSSCM